MANIIPSPSLYLCYLLPNLSDANILEYFKTIYINFMERCQSINARQMRYGYAWKVHRQGIIFHRLNAAKEVDEDPSINIYKIDPVKYEENARKSLVEYQTPYKLRNIDYEDEFTFAENINRLIMAKLPLSMSIKVDRIGGRENWLLEIHNNIMPYISLSILNCEHNETNTDFEIDDKKWISECILRDVFHLAFLYSSRYDANRQIAKAFSLKPGEFCYIGRLFYIYIELKRRALATSTFARNGRGQIVISGENESLKWINFIAAIKFIFDEFIDREHFIKSLASEIDQGKFTIDCDKIIIDKLGINNVQNLFKYLPVSYNEWFSVV